MGSSSLYRSNAEDCLRMARTAQDECDKSFWFSLADRTLHTKLDVGGTSGFKSGCLHGLSAHGDRHDLSRSRLAQ